jgi:hypothetical protein
MPVLGSAAMRVWLAVVLALGVAAACGTVEGPLLHRIAGTDAGDDAGGAPAIAITQDISWQYQLTGEIDLEADVELLVIDLFALDTERIAQLHQQNKVVVAYLSAGTFESFRADADQFPASAIGNSLINYPDEAWLDVRHPEVRALMAARLDVARDKAFDGLLPTNLAGYRTDTGFDLTAEDQRAYSAWLADEAHARGLLIGMAGDFDQAPELIDRFDWAVHYGCIARGDCDDLDLFAERGKPVLDVETEGEVADVCAAGEQLGINVLLKSPRFDAYRVGCL